MVDVRNETEDSATVTIKPGWGFSAGVKPGTIVRLAAAKGDLALPDPPPPKILFVSAGSGITPLMAMLRTLKARGHHTDIVHVHSAPSADAVIFHDELRDDLHTERFAIARTDKGGEGGEKVGIQMPFGCRMGICQTCVLPLESGYVRDFRSGEEHGAGDRINTCVSTASGDCTLKI